ncbi:MAG TPA: TrkH family potassium uptake protein [Geminicoccaceae bacterium]|nr:TrkH family potassium uptake protein [Geminicoccaceae bacterium]
MAAGDAPGRSWGIAAVLFVVGWLLVLLGAAMLLPMLADMAAGEADWLSFAGSSIFTAFIGVLLVLANRRPRPDLQFRSIFLLTTLSWIAMVAFSSLPFQLGPYHLSLTDAVFEAMSGLTTTGSTVMTGLDRAPPGILLWRSLLQGLGGVGIIVMAIVLLPFLRVGGMQLFRTESSDRTEKLLPSTVAMVSRIVGVYLLMMLACTLALSTAGMSLFDATNHGITAVATAGFSTRDASVGGFQNPAAEWIITLFMFVGALPLVRFVALLQGRPRLLLRDSQVRVFSLFCVLVILVVTFWLVVGQGREIHAALRLAAFNCVSIITTTGFATDDYQLWGSPAIALFLALTIVGGCTGSTAGGIKTFRFEILWTAAQLYLVSLFLPNRVHRPRYDDKPIDNEIIFAVLSFVFLFIGSWGMLTVLLGALGLDLVTAISAAATALANVGPGLGTIVGPAGNFQPLSDPVKWVLTAAMLLGRLEFFTVLVLFHPAFWRR